MARLGSAPATAGEAHPPGVLSRDRERSAAPRSRCRRRRRAAVADGGERRRRRRVDAPDAHRTGGDAVLAWPDRLALGPRRRGSRGDRARRAGALAHQGAGAGIDRRATAGESGDRRAPARAVRAAGRASAGRPAARRERRRPAPRSGAPPECSRHGDIGASLERHAATRADPVLALARALEAIPESAWNEARRTNQRAYRRR